METNNGQNACKINSVIFRSRIDNSKGVAKVGIFVDEKIWVSTSDLTGNSIDFVQVIGNMKSRGKELFSHALILGLRQPQSNQKKCECKSHKEF